MGAKLLLNRKRLLLTSAGDSYYVKALLTKSDESNPFSYEGVGNIFIPLKDVTEEKGDYSVNMSQESYSVSVPRDGKYETIHYCLDDTLSAIMNYMQHSTYFLTVSESAISDDKYKDSSFRVTCDMPASLLSTHKSRNAFLSIPRNHVVLWDGKGKAWIRLAYKSSDEKEIQTVIFSAQKKNGDWYAASMPIEQFLQEVEQHRKQPQKQKEIWAKLQKNIEYRFNEFLIHNEGRYTVLDKFLDWPERCKIAKVAGKYLTVIYPSRDGAWNLEVLSSKEDGSTECVRIRKSLERFGGEIPLEQCEETPCDIYVENLIFQTKEAALNTFKRMMKLKEELANGQEGKN